MPTIPNAPNGQKPSVDGTEGVPVSGSFYVLISQIAEYIRTLAQTLTNKTLTTPTIGDFSNAQHTHGGASSGGLIGSTAFPKSIMDGLILSNNVTDANNDIDIAAGQAVDDAGTYNLILAAAITKQLDVNWAVGTNTGGLDTGAKANSTWYHVWLIARSDTGIVDVLFSLSATAPTMPGSYTKKRRIGAIKTDSSGNIIPFLQYGDEFVWPTPVLDVSVTNQGASRINYVLASVPAGIIVKANLNILIGSASAATFVYVSNPNLADLAPSETVAPLLTLRNQVANLMMEEKISAWTDSSAQISARADAASRTFRVATLGWEDPRGKR